MGTVVTSPRAPGGQPHRTSLTGVPGVVQRGCSAYLEFKSCSAMIAA